MLLRFRVANVRSLRDEQELSFVVPPGQDATVGRTLDLAGGKSVAVYPLLGVFGANASGKSDVLAAAVQMRNAVRRPDWPAFQAAADAVGVHRGHAHRALPGPRYAGTGSGMVTNTHAVAPRCAMLTPATWSAGPSRPHRRHWKWSRTGRLPRSVWPQRGQRCEV
jgi:hypothetical protein